MISNIELENRVVELYSALENLLENAAVITPPGADDCFVDLQCRTPDYDAAYAALAKARPAKLPELPAE